MVLIAEIGSTHGGIEQECYNAIVSASNAGVTYVKFQLLEKMHLGYGNIPIENMWLPELIKFGRNKGVNVFASCWSHDAIDLLVDAGATTIKLAYSERENKELIDHACLEFNEVFISCDFMTSDLPDKATKLYCIPLYPVPYVVNFNRVFRHFDGFSDHTLGISQSFKAIYHGAKFIEKHVKQTDCKCPDAEFAVNWQDMDDLAHMRLRIADGR